MSVPTCLSIVPFITDLFEVTHDPAVPIHTPLRRSADCLFSSSINCAFMFMTRLHMVLGTCIMLVHVYNMVHMVKMLVLVTRGRKCATYCLVSNALKCCCCSGVLGEENTFFFYLQILLTVPAGSLNHLYLNVVLEFFALSTSLYICTSLCILTR